MREYLIEREDFAIMHKCLMMHVCRKSYLTKHEFKWSNGKWTDLHTNHFPNDAV